jgi:two-component system OmpR family sensor kinase/two-component system sensor histidine kinase BaeS
LVLGFALWGVYSIARLITAHLGIEGWAAPILVAVLLFAAAAAARAFGAMRRFGNPLRAIMDAAEQVAEGDYTARVREEGPPPMRALAHSFNTMTAKLQSADRQRRELMADLAHELRTPLSVLQGRIEGLIDGVYKPEPGEFEQLLDQTKVLSRLIEDLRTLALSDAGVLTLQRETTDLVHLVRTAVRNFEAEAKRQSVDLRVHVPSYPVALDVDAVRIQEVLVNLLSNALQHASNGHAVDVTLAKYPDGIVITVKDDGSGMSQDNVAHLFDRFYKRAGSQGSGLGLTIARQLVHAHGGEIEAASVLGQGTTVKVTLPADEPTSA